MPKNVFTENGGIGEADDISASVGFSMIVNAFPMVMLQAEERALFGFEFKKHEVQIDFIIVEEFCSAFRLAVGEWAHWASWAFGGRVPLVFARGF